MYEKLNGISLSGIRGSHYVQGQEYVYFVASNGTVGDSSGKIQRVRLTPVELLWSEQKAISSSPASQINLDGTGTWDVQWTVLSGVQKVSRNFTASLYKFPSAPSGGLSTIDPSSLASLAYSTSAIPEDGQGDNYYAAKLGSSAPNYAVFRIYLDPADSQTKIEWLAYKVNSNPETIGLGYDDPRDLVLTANMGMAYVTALDFEGLPHILAVNNSESPTASSPKFDIYDAYAIEDPDQAIDDPQQLALYEDKIYFVDATALWCIDQAGPSQTKVADIANGGMGLLINDEGIALITDKLGNLVEVDLATGIVTPQNSFPAPTGFLTWADDGKTAFYATVLDSGDPATGNRVCMVDVTTMSIATYADLNTLSPAVANPWSVEALSPTRIFIASDTELGTLELMITSSDLVLGIGLVPFQYIIQDPGSIHRGFADTTPAVGYFFQMDKVPFGGNLYLLLNHDKANTLGITHYRVSFKNLATGVTRDVTDPFTDLLWTQVGGKPGFYATPTISTGPTPASPLPANAFPVRNPDDLWYNPYWSAVLKTAIADNGLNEVTFTFFQADGTEVVAEEKSYVVYVDNNICKALVQLPRIGNPPPGEYPTPDCGCIPYDNKDDKVEIDFIASQLYGNGSYTLTISRGGQGLPTLTESGVAISTQDFRTKSTTNIAGSPTLKVGHLVGDCNIAQISVAIHVPRRVTNGYSWLSAAYSARHFALVPSATPMSTPWVDPGG